jgi:hypothetical protein
MILFFIFTIATWTTNHIRLVELPYSVDSDKSMESWRVPAARKRVTEYLILERRMWIPGVWQFREQTWPIFKACKSNFLFDTLFNYSLIDILKQEFLLILSCERAQNYNPNFQPDSGGTNDTLNLV